MVPEALALALGLPRPSAHFERINIILYHFTRSSMLVSQLLSAVPRVSVDLPRPVNLPPTTDVTTVEQKHDRLQA